MPLPLPDPYIVRGDPGQEYADGPGTQRNFDAIKAVLDVPLETVRYVGVGSNPAFQNAWANLDAAAGPTGRAAGFYRHNGRVYLTGAIQSGAPAVAAFTLPPGYQPLQQTDTAMAVPVVASGGIAQLNIRVNGEVRPTNVGATNVATTTFLDGVSFRHA